MPQNYDIIIVGAGTSGSFAAYQLSKMGFRTGIIERKPKEEIGNKVCGDAIGSHHFDQIKLKKPKLGYDAETIFKGIKVYAPNEKSYILASGKGYALNRYNFGQRILKMALDVGAELYDKHHVLQPIIEGSRVKGVIATNLKTGEKTEFQAKVVIDASGAIPAVRSKLPEEWWVSEKVPREDYDICYREIIELNKEVEKEYAAVYLNTEIAPGGYWWWFPKNKNTVNVGLGVQWTKEAPNPKDQFEKYIRPRIKNHIVKVIHSGGGIVPARRTISCMVWNGFIAVGDAACTANPIHGGGIGPSLLSALKAAETIKEALETDKPSIENLWSYHHKYLEIYGAKQASLNILRIYLQNLSNNDFNLILEKNILNNQDLLNVVSNAEIKMNLLTKFGITIKLLSKPSLLLKIKTVKNYMEKTQKLYLNYPKKVTQFELWQKSIKTLFNEFRNKLKH